MLDRALGAGPAIRAIYLVSLKGKVLAAGLAAEQRGLRADLLGSDVSATRLFREVVQRRRLVWGDKYLSALSGAVTVGVSAPHLSCHSGTQTEQSRSSGATKALPSVSRAVDTAAPK